MLSQVIGTDRLAPYLVKKPTVVLIGGSTGLTVLGVHSLSRMRQK